MQNKPDLTDLKNRFQSMITRFSELRAKDTAKLGKTLNQVLPGFLAERKKWAEAQRRTAEEFNLLEVLKIDGDEVSHSNLLAWVLDHRIEHGTHAQGDLGFQLFLEEFRRELGEQFVRQVAAYARNRTYWVRSEVTGAESRVDIEIAAHGKFLIHLENKIHSQEGDDQTNREWRDLQIKRKEWD